MAFIIDSTPMSALVVGRPEAAALIVPWMRTDEATTSVLVYGEVLEGLTGRPRFEVRRRILSDFLEVIIPLTVDLPIMHRYATLRRQLRPPYGRGLIGDLDTIIAATALEYDLTLVTTDSDFRRVPNLKLMLLDRHTFRPIDLNGSGSYAH